MRFQLNAREVVHELLDGEIILMHLNSGNYYSLVDSGAEIWTRVISGAAFDTIVAEFAGELMADPQLVESETQSFLQQLVDECLILPVPAELTERPNKAFVQPAGPRRPFVTPTIQKYTDMQGLLLVDPIHEVDATGWPSVNTSGT